MNRCRWSVVPILLLLSVQLSYQDFRRNGESFSINWVFSLPWDVSNTLRAPLGGPLSLILTAGLSVVLFFGMAVSPVYYFFGTPVRNYHLQDAILDRLIKTGREDEKRLFPKNATIEKVWDNDTEALYFPDGSGNGTLAVAEGLNRYPSFMESFFWLVGEEDPTCQKLMVCHAHGFFNFLPKTYLKYYRIFSRKMVGIPEDFQDAIQLGLEDQDLCKRRYTACSSSLVNISKKTIQNILPTDLSGLYNWLHKVKAWAEGD